MLKPFFMVYVEGKSSPTVKHDTADSARDEAERLCKELGAKVYVLLAMESCMVDPHPVVWETLGKFEAGASRRTG